MLSSNVVDRFHHSSYYVGRHLANQCKKLEEKYYASHSISKHKKLTISLDK
jgi:uncharacterized protein (UPF0303 family)